MKHFNKLLVVCSTILVAGCATNVTPTPIGGSKADGTVTLAFQYSMFEQPVVDWPTAQVQAVSRCKAWGYKDADSFGGQQNQCLAYNGYGSCVNTQVSITYQCTN
ncbi:MAG: hypothetical protein CL561_05205 [Alphaproteobacteria bacterium]|nr:hypothetical protein [Alphaproteobacteria bacterium]|tara:strand:+ start:80 stop:394 length:315 start_codon:yes stop_codon:yes gene_type:complete